MIAYSDNHCFCTAEIHFQTTQKRKMSEANLRYKNFKGSPLIIFVTYRVAFLLKWKTFFHFNFIIYYFCSLHCLFFVERRLWWWKKRLKNGQKKVNSNTLGCEVSRRLVTCPYYLISNTGRILIRGWVSAWFWDYSWWVCWPSFCICSCFCIWASMACIRANSASFSRSFASVLPDDCFPERKNALEGV